MDMAFVSYEYEEKKDQNISHRSRRDDRCYIGCSTSGCGNRSQERDDRFCGCKWKCQPDNDIQ